MSTGEVTSNIVFDTKIDVLGSRVATVDSKGSMNVYTTDDNKKMECIFTVQAHKGLCWRLDWSEYKEGSYIATCGLDRKCNIWSEVSYNKWENVYMYEDDNEQSINYVKFCPSKYGLKLALCNARGSISILSNTYGEWDMKCLKNEDAHNNSINSLTWAKIDNGIDKNDIPILCSASCDMSIRIFKVKPDSIVEIYRIEGMFHDSIRDIDWCKTTIMDNNLLAVGSQDKQLAILEIYKDKDGKIQHDVVFETKLESEVWRVKWNRTGTLLGASYIEKGLFNKVCFIKTLDGVKWQHSEGLYVSSN